MDKNNASVKECNTQMDEEINVKVRPSNVEIKNTENLDFHMFWNNIWIGI